MNIEDAISEINNTALANLSDVREAIWTLTGCIEELNARLKKLEAKPK